MFYVYLIKSDEGLRYIGHTPTLEKRLMEHNSGTCHSTKRGTNWKIIYTEEFTTRSEAMKREKWFKSGVGRQWANDNIAGWSPPSAE
ncbi:MAG: GIY-YIG nuclease family protein [Bacteroidetes bacterium]|nr:MAG: GIY-YIG nuclease family protein [Bacteroidota bacterium]